MTCTITLYSHTNFICLKLFKRETTLNFLTNFTLKNLPSCPVALTMNLNPKHTNKKNWLNFQKNIHRHIWGMLSYTLFLIVIDICCIKKGKINCSLKKHEKPTNFLPMDIHVSIPCFTSSPMTHQMQYHWTSNLSLSPVLFLTIPVYKGPPCSY